MTDFTWPQSGDWADAANFAFADRKENVVDYVEEGLNFTVDYATPAVDISAGKAIVSDPSASSSNTGETRNNVAYAVWLDARSGVGLTDLAVNHIWMDAQVGSDDSPRIVVNTDNTQPTSHSIKIGEIDTSNDTATELNRAPTGRFQSIGLAQGSSDEFEFDYDLSADELVLRDTENDVELFRQPKQGPMTFLQGIDAGSIEAPEDSYTQILNSAITSSSASGDTVGYTFAVNNSTGYALQGESDGSGGLTRLDHEFRDSAGSTLFSVRDTGPVEVTNTTLNVPDENLNLGASINALSGNSLHIRTGGGGADHFIIRDVSAAANKFRVQEGGPVEIRNANLDMTDAQVQNVTAITSSSSGGLSLNIEQSGNWAGIWDNVNGQALLQAYEGGPIEISNANLQMNGNGIEGVTSLSSLGNIGVDLDSNNNSTAGNYFEVTSNGGAESLFKISSEGGPVEVKNAPFQINNGNNLGFNSAGTSDFQIRNDTGANALQIYNANDSTYKFHVDSTNVEVRNANLKVNNNSGTEVIGVPVYASESDLPNASEGSIAYVSGTGELYVEDGT